MGYFARFLAFLQNLNFTNYHVQPRKSLGIKWEYYKQDKRIGELMNHTPIAIVDYTLHAFFVAEMCAKD